MAARDGANLNTDADEKCPGEALCVVEISSTGLVFHRENLERVFLHPDIGNKPVAIISVAGIYRSGKSFLLNFFLRYLAKKGYQSHKKVSDWLGGPKATVASGFEWKEGFEAHTRGIILWSEPFMVKRGGKEIAVLLMDTQGGEDVGVDAKGRSLIYIISLLFSSIWVYNISKKINATDLEKLQFCQEYLEKALGKSDYGCQRLMVLVRDWGMSEKHGEKPGKSYLDHVVKEFVQKQKHAKSVYSTFKEVQCFLMPYPGRKVETRSEGLLMEDINELFHEHLPGLLECLLKPENITPKTMKGEHISARNFLEYFIGCCRKFQDGRYADPKGLLELNAEIDAKEALDACKKYYRNKMDEVCMTRK